MTGGINGAYTSISGTLKRVTAEWVVIEQNGDEISVPKSVVLLIQQSPQ
jgi:RNase P/RNase MRP subunit p29